jgi:general secretion pathway protein N
MRPALALAAGALLLAGALLATAPAALLDARVAALSDGHLHMDNTSGTVWNGSGELVLLPAGTRQALHWRLDAWPLLRGEMRAAIVKETAGAPSATVVYGRDHLELRTLELALPAESILALASPAKLALGGTVWVQVEHLVWSNNALDAQLNVQWRDASVPGPPGPRADARIALGDVRIDLNGRGSELAGPVSNSGGDVEISGQLAVAAAGASSLDATLRPRGGGRERADAVTAALSTLGVPDGQGGYHVRWSGAWR